MRNQYTTVVRKGRVIRCKPHWSNVEYFAGLKLQIEALVEPRLSPAVHGWRRGHGVPTAVERITSMRGTCAGLDIVGYFEHVDQERLRRKVCTLPSGQRMWERIAVCLPPSGLPDGASFSPVLANLYLDEIDRRFALTRYADNIVIVADGKRRAARQLHALKAQLLDMDLRSHEIEIGEVSFCRQRLITTRDQRIIHVGR